MTTDQFNPFAEFQATPQVLPPSGASKDSSETVRRIVREELCEVFADIAEWAGSAAQWEYDSVTSGALNRIGDMAAQVTERLGRRLADDQS